jgi:hypothetical protein
MSEIVNDCFCPALVHCFFGLEFKNINGLLLISLPRARLLSKHSLDRFAVIGPFTAGTARLLVVISLFWFCRIKEFRGLRPLPAVFSLR